MHAERPLLLLLLLSIVIFCADCRSSKAALSIASAVSEEPESFPSSPPYLHQLRKTDIELLSWRTLAALVCGAAAATVSSAGGIGGGGLYVPIFNLLLGFDSKTSAALSCCMILGGTVVSVVWYSTQHRSDGLGPLIDYQVALFCLPNVLLGISMGVLFNVMSPSWFLTILLTIILFFMTFRSCHKALQRWNVESPTIEPVRLSDSDKTASNAGTSFAAHAPSALPSHPTNAVRNDVDDVKDLEKPLLEPPRRKQPLFPIRQVSLLYIIWLVFLAVQLFRSQNIFSNIEVCGATYWIITFLQVPFAIIASVCIVIYLRKKSPENTNATDTEQNYTSSSLLPLYALGAGVLGGMLGLGGGMVINPFFLELGLHPQVAAATCSYMIFFSSSLSVIQFWLLGRIPEKYALISAAISFVFSVIGLQVIKTLIAKYGRASFIVFAVSIVMGISAALMLFFGSWDVIKQIKEGASLGFGSPCSD